MALRVDEDHPSVVLIGGFDPARFHPAWFRSEKLLGEQEAEQAQSRLKVVHPEISDWSTEWLQVQVTRERLYMVATSVTGAEPLRDMCLGILQLLEKSRVTRMGINRSMHIDVGGEPNWHRIGDWLAPKDVWKPHMPTRPGMRTLQIEEGTRADGLKGKLFVTVQPSEKTRFAVYFDVNNDLSVDDDNAGTAFWIKILNDHWARLQKEAGEMASAVLTKALAERPQ